MGPYQYESRVIKRGMFSFRETVEKAIQEELEHHTAAGWELAHIHPICNSSGWYETLLVFRKPAQAEF